MFLVEIKVQKLIKKSIIPKRASTADLLNVNLAV